MNIIRRGVNCLLIYDTIRVIYFLSLLLSSPSFCEELNIFFGFPIFCIVCKYHHARNDEILYQKCHDDIPIFFMMFTFYVLNLFGNCYGNPLLILSIITYVVISLFYMAYIHNNWGTPIELEIDQVDINNPSDNTTTIALSHIRDNEERNSLLQFIPNYTINQLNDPIDYDCPICLEPQNNLNESVMFVCKHFYHKKCIVRWIRTGNNKVCPVCKETLKLSEDNII